MQQMSCEQIDTSPALPSVEEQLQWRHMVEKSVQAVLPPSHTVYLFGRQSVQSMLSHLLLLFADLVS